MTGADAASREHPRLDAIVTWNVVRAAKFLGNRLSLRLEDSGLNPIQFGILAFLETPGELTTAQLSRAVLLRQQSVAPLLDGLERRGLIAREMTRSRGKPNPVRITAEGSAVLSRMWDAACASNDLGDAGLTADDVRTLNELLLALMQPTRVIDGTASTLTRSASDATSTSCQASCPSAPTPPSAL